MGGLQVPPAAPVALVTKRSAASRAHGVSGPRWGGVFGLEATRMTAPSTCFVLSLWAAALARPRRRMARLASDRDEVEVTTADGVACAKFVFSAKTACIHPERKAPYLCGDCPRNGKALNPEVCAAAALVSSAKSSCVHPERKPPYLCGDCPRNGMTATFDDEKVCAVAAFVSSAKSQCAHPERKPPYLCGDCPRN